MQGTASSSCSRIINQRMMYQWVRPVSGLASDKSSFPFTLPRDTPKYNGSVKPEDWLVDYMTAVGIAGGSRRVAVRYAPLMLQGLARSWLNSLPINNINCWKDFDDAFVSNFTTHMSVQVYVGTWRCVYKERTSPFAITFSGSSSS